jgi:hypothetical protein
MASGCCEHVSTTPRLPMPLIMDCARTPLIHLGRMRRDSGAAPPPQDRHPATLGVLTDDGDIPRTIDVLAQDVGIIGLFSDWPATTTFYANCLK